MAQKLGLFDQLFFGNWAERGAINKNAEDLSIVEADLGKLRDVVQRQSQEILQLRAMFLGLIEVLEAKVSLDEAELEQAVRAAMTKLMPPPPEPKSQATDPYRGTPVEVSAAEIEAAKALLATAQRHHFARQFQEARALYQQIIDQHGNTKQAVTAKQQLENLRNV